MNTHRTAARGIDYAAIMRKQILGTVKAALTQVAEHGLYEPHALNVTFQTGYPGVVVPAWLLEAFPDAMTIVLEHQFWRLAVDDEGFSVDLSFKNKIERITVPFESIIQFTDLGVKFGFEISPMPIKAEPVKATAAETPVAAAGGGDEDGKVVSLFPRAKK